MRGRVQRANYLSWSFATLSCSPKSPCIYGSVSGSTREAQRIGYLGFDQPKPPLDQNYPVLIVRAKLTRYLKWSMSSSASYWTINYNVLKILGFLMINDFISSNYMQISVKKWYVFLRRHTKNQCTKSFSFRVGFLGQKYVVFTKKIHVVRRRERVCCKRKVVLAYFFHTTPPASINFARSAYLFWIYYSPRSIAENRDTFPKS